MPVWDWGLGAQLINDDASAIAALVIGGPTRRTLRVPAGFPGRAGIPLGAAPTAGAARSGCGPLTPVLGERQGAGWGALAGRGHLPGALRGAETNSAPKGLARRRRPMWETLPRD